MDAPKKKKWFPLVTSLIDTFGFTPALAFVVAFAVAGLCVLALGWVVHSAPPRKLVITSGPEGSSFRRFADTYQKILATHGIALEILESQGSTENLQRLQSANPRVDIGFVQGGLPKETKLAGLVSLGSIAYQPLWVFYRAPASISRLAELTGKRIAVGAVGSGTHALALALLSANGVTGDTAVISDLDAEGAAAGLLAG